MAISKVFNGTPGKNRARPLTEVTVPTSTPTTIQPGVPVVISGAPAVSLTASGNGTKTTSNPVPGVTSITVDNGGASLDAGWATFAFDGTYNFAVVGATTSTASGVKVYITNAGGLTTTEGTNTFYGSTDYPVDYRKKAGFAPVKIGA